jgi:hypothetical protein
MKEHIKRLKNKIKLNEEAYDRLKISSKFSGVYNVSVVNKESKLSFLRGKIKAYKEVLEDLEEEIKEP